MDELARLIAVNVVATMLCCREAVRRMSSGRGGRGGAIVDVSSMAAATGGRPGSSHYAATKAAVDAFTIGLAKEVATEGIRVNAVRPGMTLTDMTEPALGDPAAHAAMAATIAMNGVAAPARPRAPALPWSIATMRLWASAGKLSGRLSDHLSYDLCTTRVGGCMPLVAPAHPRPPNAT